MKKKLHFTCDGENSTSVYHYAQNEAFTEWYFNYSAQGVERAGDMECGCKILVNENLIGASKRETTSAAATAGMILIPCALACPRNH